MARKKDKSIIFLIAFVSYLNCNGMEEILLGDNSSPDQSIANFIEKVQFPEDSRPFVLKAFNNEIERAQKLSDGKQIIFKSLTEIYDPDKKMKAWIIKLKSIENEFYENEKIFNKTMREVEEDVDSKNICKIIAKFKETDEEYLQDLKTFLRVTLPKWQNELLAQIQLAKPEIPVIEKLKIIETEETTTTCSPCRRRKNKKSPSPQPHQRKEIERSTSREQVEIFQEKVDKINWFYFRKVGNINAYLALERQFNFYDTGEQSELPKEEFMKNAIEGTIERLLKNQYYIPDMVALSIAGATMSQM